MPLMTYKDTRPWARSIREAVVQRKMPPWHADPKIGDFLNDPRLTDAEIATIDAWVRTGTKEGAAKDLPPAPMFAEGWHIKPDLVLTIPEFTVTGGSQEYVKRLSSPLRDRIRLRTDVSSVVRDKDGVRVRDSSGAEDRFDHVIFASHADQTLRMLTDASEAERAILGGFTYYANTVHLHHDCDLMPRSRAYWATWNYFGNHDDDVNRPVAHTYWMNKLQGIDDRFPTFISLNPLQSPNEALLERTYRYEHPTLDPATVAAQRELAHIQGKNRAWFCGSCYERGGSHEDALRTGLNVARSFGVDLPWS